MDHILWLARIFGPFYFIIGLWVLTRQDDLQKMANSCRSNPGLFYMGAMLNLLIGLGVLSTYNTWSFGLAVLITIIGWVWVIRGLLAFFAPEKYLSLCDKMDAKRSQWGILWMVVGFLLSWLAFI